MKKLYRLEKEDCYSISEIAERFQISEGSVNSHIRNIQYQPDGGESIYMLQKWEMTTLYNGNDFI